MDRALFALLVHYITYPQSGGLFEYEGLGRFGVTEHEDEAPLDHGSITAYWLS